MFEVTLSSQSGTANSVSLTDFTVDTKQLEEATAAFCCDVSMSATMPNSGLIDRNASCEAWLWDCHPGLDLHGWCPTCEAYAFALYGWEL